MDKKEIKKLTATAILFAVALVLSLLESLLWQPVGGVRLGLSNVVVMFALFSLGVGPACSIGVLKCFFVLLTRGLPAGILSLSGFALSFLILVLLHRVFRDRISYILLSVSGALAHNTAQLAVVSLLFNTPLALYYLPILGISGIIAGIITATVLRICMPILNKIGEIG